MNIYEKSNKLRDKIIKLRKELKELEKQWQELWDEGIDDDMAYEEIAENLDSIKETLIPIVEDSFKK